MMPASNDIPPPPIVGADAPPSSPEYKGSLLPWLLVVLIFGLLIGGSIWSAFGPKSTKPKVVTATSPELTQARSTIKWLTAMQRLAGDSQLVSGQNRSSYMQLLDNLPKTGTESIRLRAVLREEASMKADASELEQLRKDDPYRLIYSSEKLTKEKAQQLALRVEKQTAAGEVAAVHALEKAGDKGARAERISTAPGIKLFFAGLGGMLVLTVGLIGWVAFFAVRKHWFPYAGELPWIRDRQDADAAAYRVAMIMASFLMLSILVQMLNLPSGLSNIVQGVGTVLATLGIVGAPILDRPISLSALGFHKHELGKRIIMGVVLFCMELPVVGILALAAQKLLQFLPAPSHPASNELMNNPSQLSIIGILIFGGIAAPIWEEICFRAFLFAGLARRWMSVVAAALVSSFTFSMIHPQGPTLWVALASVGVAGCMAVYLTRSIVTSISMHMAHNLTLLTMSVILFS